MNTIKILALKTWQTMGALFSFWTPLTIRYPDGRIFKIAESDEEGVQMDKEAIAHDWHAVGNDMRRAMGMPLTDFNQNEYDADKPKSSKTKSKSSKTKSKSSKTKSKSLGTSR